MQKLQIPIIGGLMVVFFSLAGVADNTLDLSKCSSNIQLIDRLVSGGVIRDSTYIGFKALLGSADLSKKRREFNVNQDELKKRIIELKSINTAGRGWECLNASALLLRNLSSFADYATGAGVNMGLNKIVPDWMVKAYLVGADVPMPGDMPPTLPAR